MLFASNKWEVECHSREMAAGFQGGFGKKLGKVHVPGNLVQMGWRNKLSLKGIRGKAPNLLMSENHHCHSLCKRKLKVAAVE